VAIAAVLAIAPAHADTRVYLVRGLVGWLFAPMNELAGELRARGANVTTGSWLQAAALAADACAHRADRIVAVGHSLGGPAAAAIAMTARACGAGDVTLVSIDPPPNAAAVHGIRATNFVGALGGRIIGARNMPAPGYDHVHRNRKDRAMLQDVLPYLLGGAAPVSLYLGYVGYTKGWPAVRAKVASWWSKGKSELAGVKGDLASFQQSIEPRVAALEKLVLTQPARAPAAAAAPLVAPPAPAPAAAPAAQTQG
jgi:pimeloyl-ACP methyl ester carboxylesterase